jgi:hypothetical protein
MPYYKDKTRKGLAMKSIAVRCKENWQCCAVQAICDGTWEHVVVAESLRERPIVYSRKETGFVVFNWIPQAPNTKVLSFDEFVIEYGELMHNVDGEWSNEFE